MEQEAPDDTCLVEEALGGNPASFQLLVERYEQRIFNLIRHYTRNPVEIEDLAQETFLKVYRRLSSFQRQSSFYTWLYRIAVNTMPVQAVEDLEAVPVPSSVAIQSPSATLEREELARITHDVLEELPEIFRTVLVLREYEDMAYQDIADLLGISIGTVESRLFRARARFKERLLQQHPEFGNES